MGSILHGNAKTTPRTRQEIQNSQESIAVLSKRLGVNPKTVLHWRQAAAPEDKKSGPKTRKSALTEIEQQAVCAVRRHARLSLDDLFIVFKPRIPALTRSNLHRCLASITAYHAYPRMRAWRGRKNPSKPTPLVTFMLTSLSCTARQESGICLWPLIARPNTSTPSSMSA